MWNRILNKLSFVKIYNKNINKNICTTFISKINFCFNLEGDEIAQFLQKLELN